MIFGDKDVEKRLQELQEENKQIRADQNRLWEIVERLLELLDSRTESGK